MKSNKIISESNQKNNEPFSTFYKVSEVLRSGFDLDRLLNEIIMLTVNEMGAKVGSIMLQENDYLVVRASCGDDGYSRVGQVKKIGNGISGWVAKKGKGLLIKNISKDPDFKQHFNPRYKSPDLISAPIMVKDKIYGVINVNYKRSKKPFDESDLKMLLFLANSIGLVIDNFHLMEDVRTKERTATIEELSARLAHEIRNPLNGIKMNVQILWKNNRLAIQKPGDMEEHYRIILDEIGRLDDLLKMILDHSRVEKFKKEPVDVNMVLEKSLSTIFLSESEIKIKKRFGKALKITGDKDKLQQAFLNVLLNAVQSMEGKGTISINVKKWKPIGAGNTADKKDFIQIDISDTGKGILKKDQKKIFSPFFTTRADGTGFGLSITEKIIKQHHGRISFSSQAGKGTVFHILLPIKKGAE